MSKQCDKALFSTPFCKNYWKLSFSELKNVRMLVLAAVIVALRVAVKSITIPLMEGLHISLDFFVNSVGSMIYGPVLGIIVGACSDTIGALLFPSGVYFFPFIFVEMTSSFIFGLFLYRSKLTVTRIIFARFSVVVFDNLFLNQIIMKYYYTIIYNKDYAIFRLPRLIKNLCLFPFESLLLVIFLSAVSVGTYKLGFTYCKQENLKIDKKAIITLIILTLISAAFIGFYCYYTLVLA